MADSNNANLDERVTNLERQVAVIATKVDNLVQTVDKARLEML